ncbi:hypothetical protein SAMN04515683_0927 [Leifsonia sp. 157MF]|nr:hypothetical protein SAMN04515683_0927 [Leifsonia sp. 157MF]
MSGIAGVSATAVAAAAFAGTDEIHTLVLGRALTGLAAFA